MKTLAAALLALYKREPVRANGIIAGLVIVGLAHAGIVNVKASDVASVVAFVVPVLLAELARKSTTPTASK